MCPKARSMLVVMPNMGKVARERWVSLASTVSIQRLAACLPGLVCPYRQVRLCPLTRGTHPNHLLLCRGLLCFQGCSTYELLRIPLKRTSENPQKAKFAEFGLCEVGSRGQVEGPRLL